MICCSIPLTSSSSWEHHSTSVNYFLGLNETRRSLISSTEANFWHHTSTIWPYNNSQGMFGVCWHLEYVPRLLALIHPI